MNDETWTKAWRLAAKNRRLVELQTGVDEALARREKREAAAAERRTLRARAAEIDEADRLARLAAGIERIVFGRESE